MSMDQDKLVDLEIKIGFVERTVEELSGVVIEQGNTIERLERRIQVLDERLSSKQDGGPQDTPDPLDERPPHY